MQAGTRIHFISNVQVLVNEKKKFIIVTTLITNKYY